VDEAINGEDALGKVRQRDYDAILMDIQMPVMDGLQAAHRIRAMGEAPGGERFASVPIIAMTALAMAQDAEKSRAAGMNDHVTKPIAPDRLMAVLGEWVRIPPSRAAAGRQIGTADRATGEIPQELAALASLDARDGIRRIGGKVDAYRKQLRRFREHYPDPVGELRRLVEEQGLERAAEYCHALKGVSGNIGAVALYGKIAEIDARLKQGRTPTETEWEGSRISQQQVIADIDSLAAAAAPAPAVGPPLNRAEIVERLDRLADALEHDLGAAEPILAELRSGMAGDTSEPILGEVSAKVDVFAVDDALAQVNVLRRRFKPAV